jgi:hypothetical protein
MKSLKAPAKKDVVEQVNNELGFPKKVAKR